MSLKIAAKLGWMGLFVALLLSGTGQSAAEAAQPAIAVSAELQNLAARAQTIFVGQIVSIEHKNSVVEVSFRVEQPVAGAPAAICTMREWAGLWAPGQNRYSVGQRVLAFLHAASGSGLSSPVHGAEGLVPVVVQGTDAPELLDVRRVAASVVRAPGTPLPTEALAAVQLNDVLALIRPAEQASSFEPIRMVLPGRGRRPVDLATAPYAPASLLRGTVQRTSPPMMLTGAQ